MSIHREAMKNHENRQFSRKSPRKSQKCRNFSIQNVYMTTFKNPKKPAPQDWHKADIKAAVEKAGYTLRELARRHAVSRTYFAEALHRPLPKAQAILAEVIGVSPQTIWPSRYYSDGSPRRGLYHDSEQNEKDYLERMVRKDPEASKEI